MIGYLDVAAAAQFLCRSPRWIRQHVGEIPHFRPNGQILFAVEDLKHYMARFRVEPKEIDIRGIVNRVTRPSGQRGDGGRFRGGGAA